jgi:quercetin dioxygenase-like cupin family protein
VVATYLAGGNTRRLRGALAPLLKAAPLSKSSVSRMVGAVGLVWPKAGVQRGVVHKLRNLERKAPKHALAEIRDDFHRIVYAASADGARAAYAAFERTWAKRCSGVVTSLREGGDELLTFFIFPRAQWKTLRTTNTIERLHEELRRRVKTQGSLPSEDAALIPALQPRGERADRVAQNRRLAEDGRGAQPANGGGGVTPRAFRFAASEITRRIAMQRVASMWSLTQLTAPVLTLAALALTSGGAVGQERGIVRPDPPVLRETVGGMPRGEQQELRVLTATFKPGDKTVFHTHRFPVTVYILEGAFTLEMEGRAPVTIKAGQAMVEPPNVKMTGYNRSATDPIRLVIFYVSDPETPFLDPIQ